jgi:zinc transport system permease protein
MLEFLSDLHHYPFLQYALLAGVLASVASGLVGSYVTVRRTTYVAGAISHTLLGGMGAARYCQKVYGWEFFTPLLGALLAALLAAVIIALVSAYGKQREDTVLGAVWAIGMAVGILFISRTPGYNEDLMSYLFGDILMVAKSDLWLLVGLDLLVAAITLLFYHKLLAVSFDPEFALLRGLRVEWYQLLLLGLVALTVVLLVKVVGIVLVIALLTLPAAAAGQFARRLWQVMLLAVGICLLCTVGGLAASYAPNLPSGPTIILLAGGVYLLSLVGRRFRRAPAGKIN